MEFPGRNSAAKLGIGLPATAYVTMLPAMFVVSEEAAAAIRTAYEQEGELTVRGKPSGRCWRSSRN